MPNDGLPADAVPIPGFERYRITPRGEVFSNRRSKSTREFPWFKLKSGAQRSGHCRVELGRDNYRFVHRLVLETFVGSAPAGTDCRHLDGNPANNNVENLAWGTAKENAHDRKLHGTQKYGGGMRLAKLTEDEVREIYESGSKGRGRGSGLGLGNEKRVSAKSLAEKYGVSDKTIEAIWYGKSWNHITGLQKKELKWRPAASGLPRGRPRKKLSQPGDSPEQSEPNVT